MIVCNSTLAAACLLGGILFAQSPALLAANSKPILPGSVQACISRKEVAISITLETTTNPYYLRGDFDSDGNVDYAVSVQGRKTKRAGVVLCHASGLVTVLGADTVHRPPFSDLAGDQFLSADWCVVSKREAMQHIGKRKIEYYPIGEVILMPWDDGVGMVYFDGIAYRWLTLRRADRR